MRPGSDADAAFAATDAAAPRTQTQPGTRSAAGPELPQGLQLDHFRIDRKLGAGGMGEVYLATDLALDRPVAIKVLPASSVSERARDRMVREARAQASVHHPNVAHIYFIGEADGRLYFAMEYVAGQTLADKLAAGPLPVDEALAMIHAAALGLREAQRAGFTHRDVKPSNLMVDSHGMVKVVDFGLASGQPELVADGPVAQTTIAGTPLYMAPEQARGEPIDLRADIYALGATLYHLVSGHPPFQADTVAELMTLHASGKRPAIPRGANARTAITAIDALIARMMAPVPGDRFASYDELLTAVELVSTEHTRPAGFWVRAIATGLDLLLVVLLVALATTALGQGDLNAGRFGIPVAAALAAFTIARWGTTPGKRLFELEVVSAATGHRPSWRQAAVREAIMATPIVVLSWLSYLGRMYELSGIPRDAFGILGIAFSILLGVDLANAAIRSVGKRTAWDRKSGTLVRYRTTRRAAPDPLLPST